MPTSASLVAFSTTLPWPIRISPRLGALGLRNAQIAIWVCGATVSNLRPVKGGWYRRLAVGDTESGSVHPILGFFNCFYTLLKLQTFQLRAMATMVPVGIAALFPPIQPVVTPMVRNLQARICSRV